MTLTIQISDSVYEKIKIRADSLGKAPESYLAEIAEKQCADDPSMSGLVGDDEFQVLKARAFKEHAEVLRRLAK